MLVALGLRSAPTPVRTYFAVSSLFGAVPAIAWVAWKNRERIGTMLGRVTSGQKGALAQRAASSPSASSSRSRVASVSA